MEAVWGGPVGLRAGLHGHVSLRLDNPITKRFLKTLLARAFSEQGLREQNTSFNGAAAQVGEAEGQLVPARARKISGGQTLGLGPRS